MDIEEFSEKFGDKMAEMKAYLEGGDVRELMAGLAIEHFRDSFHREGFVDKVVNPWQEVKRRQPDSPWYGHSGQTGKYSQARTTAPILSGETGHLANAFEYVPTERGVTIRNTATYAAVHQYGLPAKVYGKTPFRMPKRPFMGQSEKLSGEIREEIIRDLVDIIKR